MKKDGILKSVFDAINDPERAFTERVYLGLTLVSEITVFIAFIGDILTKENPYEIAVILAALIFTPLIMIVCLRKNRLQLGIKITVLGVVFFVLPSLFFFGGGVEGGGVLWIIFTFTFAGLVLTGTWRTAIFIFIIIISSMCYLMEYYHPKLIYEHTRDIFLIDSFLSIVLVGFVCFAMTRFQNRLFMDENARAKKAAEKAEELTKSQNRFFSSMSHPNYAKMVREWLGDIYKVDIVVSGAQCLTFLSRSEVDLILLDYEMPVVDGQQVLQMLREDSVTASIPVIFLTGVGKKESVAKVLSLKPQGYILKSTKKKELLVTLRDFFYKKNH